MQQAARPSLEHIKRSERSVAVACVGSVLLAVTAAGLLLDNLAAALSPHAASAQEAEAVEKYGVELFKAEGHYSTVYSQQGTEHAQEMAAILDALYDKWLARYSGYFPKFRELGPNEDKDQYRAQKATYDECAELFKKFPILDKSFARQVAKHLKKRTNIEEDISQAEERIEGARDDAGRKLRERQLEKLKEKLGKLHHVIDKPSRMITVEMYIGLKKTHEAIGRAATGQAYLSSGRTVVGIRDKRKETIQILAHEGFHQFLESYMKSRFQSSVGGGNYHWALEGACNFIGMEEVGGFIYPIRETRKLVRSGRIAPLSSIAGPLPGRRDAASDYSVTSFMIFLSERYRTEFHKLLSFVSGRTTRGDITTLSGFMKYARIGKTAEEFEKEFHDFVTTYTPR